MIDIKKIREEFDATVEQLARRGVEKANVQKAKDLDEKRRSLISETETLKAKRNSASKEIGMIAKQGGDIAAAKEEMRKIGDRIAEIDRELAVVETDLRDTLLSIPNLPAPEIPTGMDSESNVVVRTVGEWKAPAYEIPDHMTIGEKLGIFDFPRGVKLTGTGFPILLGQGAKLHIKEIVKAVEKKALFIVVTLECQRERANVYVQIKHEHDRNRQSHHRYVKYEALLFIRLHAGAFFNFFRLIFLHFFRPFLLHSKITRQLFSSLPKRRPQSKGI